jgi:hypothetical protein
MSMHRATIKRTCSSAEFVNGRYSREHTRSLTVESLCLHRRLPPLFRPHGQTQPMLIPRRRTSRQCPACRMLTFLYLASKEGFQVDSYEDEAIGAMTKNESGTPWVSSVTLQPKIRYSGPKQPDPVEQVRLPHEAHEQCFIAQSIKTEVKVHAG